jgi:hypothetical protein
MPQRAISGNYFSFGIAVPGILKKWPACSLLSLNVALKFFRVMGNFVNIPHQLMFHFIT